MSQVLFLNPHKRGTKARKAKARRPKTKRRTRKLFANPALPRPKRKAKRRQGYRMARRVGRTMRRNPIKLPKRAMPGTVIREQVVPAVWGAVGAIGVSASMGMVIDRLPIPENLRAGPMRDVLKGLTAVGISVLAHNVTKNPTSKHIAVGAMTMVMADAARRLMLQYAPAVKLAGLESELFSPLGYWTQPAQTPALGFDNSGGNLSMYTPPVADTATAFDPMLGEYDYASGVNY
jgi:hypothetical protein